MNIRRDSVTGVLFDADDAAQLAAHPNSQRATGATKLEPLDDHAVKLPTPIAGRVVRDMDNAKKNEP